MMQHMFLVGSHLELSNELALKAASKHYRITRSYSVVLWNRFLVDNALTSKTEININFILPQVYMIFSLSVNFVTPVEMIAVLYFGCIYKPVSLLGIICEQRFQKSSLWSFSQCSL